MPEGSGESPRTAFLAVKLVYLALLLGQVLFGGFVFFFLRSGGLDMRLEGTALKVLNFAPPLFSITAVPAAFLLRKAVFRKALGGEDEALLRGFMQGTILFGAVLEGTCMFDLMGWLFTGEFVPCGIFAVLVFLAGVLGYPRLPSPDD